MSRRLLVDLEALAANYNLFQKASSGADSRVGAVVKADGYGLGAVAVAKRLSLSGCREFFVATLEEGLVLREALGKQVTIYCFEGPATESAAQELAAALIVPVMNHDAQLRHWSNHSQLPIAVHVDTGMARLGFPTDVAAADFHGYQIQLLMTHLACADEVGHPQSARQAQGFSEVTRRFPSSRTSIGNSAGWLSGPPLQGELGRPGIGLFGGNPFSNRESPVAAVASLQGQILQLRRMSAREPVGYGGTALAEENSMIAVVALGYADGVSRALSNRGAMTVRGQRCAILGTVSMDMTMIDVSAVSDVTIGDWVECFGVNITVDEVAELAGTIAYEVLTGVGGRVERVYNGAGGG